MEHDAGEITAEKLDQKRRENLAYEYLCHLEEAKKWIEACIREELPAIGDLEENLRNGVYLAKLGNFFAPGIASRTKIFDVNQERYRCSGLHFRHIDNINHFLQAMRSVKFPEIFYPETTDIYERKNMPRLVYCIHTLSLYLFRIGKAPQIQDLYGKVQFTDEEISAMSEELKKYGLSIPQFQKIGGLLANELPVDEATLHAAILAVNEALNSEEKSESEVLAVFQNPSAHLFDVRPSLIRNYVTTLQHALELKEEGNLNRSLSDSYVADIYDNMLTQAEIQGHIKSVNLAEIMNQIKEATRKREVKEVMECLQCTNLGLGNVVKENGRYYLDEIKLRCLTDDSNVHLAILQECIDKANTKVSITEEINRSLSNGSVSDVLNCLWALSKVDPSIEIVDQAGPFYKLEMVEVRNEIGTELSYSTIVMGLKTLNHIAKINLAFTMYDEEEFLHLIAAKMAYLEGVQVNCIPDYMQEMCRARQKKIHDREGCPMLRHFEMQKIIDEVNGTQEEEQKRCDQLNRLNLAVESGNDTDLQCILTSEGSLLVEAPLDFHLFRTLLKLSLKAKRDLGSGTEKLTFRDVEGAIVTEKKTSEEFRQVLNFHSQLYYCWTTKDVPLLVSTIKTEWRVSDEVARNSADDVIDNPQMKASLLHFETERGFSVWFDLEKCWHSWEEPFNAHKYFEASDIKSTVSRIVAMNCPSFIKAIVKLQNLWRNKKRSFTLENDKFSQEIAATKIQAWWRGVRALRLYRKYKKIKDREEQLQKEIQDPFVAYKDNVQLIIVIQRAWRRYRARNDLKLLREGTPSLPTLRRFLHLLSLEKKDFEAETHLQNMKSEVVKTIRMNEQLEKDLAAMDTKIGLLVRNQISLQEVVIHGNKVNKQLKQSQKSASQDPHLQSAITLLCHTKAGKEQLNQYEQLFYIIQTQPKYLAKLLFLLPPNKASCFLEETILSIYGYGTEVREEYLFLKLFESALREEIGIRIDKMADIVTNPPLVVRLLVKYGRKGDGLENLRDLLGALLQNVIEDKSPVINTNPVEIYKSWVSQTEYKTGQPMGLPHQVSQEQALRHQEVQKQLNTSIQRLRNETVRFLKRITEAPDNLPYGILYMAKVMKSSLEEKFKDAQEKDILKVIGNLIYYQYINPAIVAPDAYGIIELLPDQLLDIQRRNLGNIAKMLQFASAKKGFGEEAPHLLGLNPFIVECHEVFKVFFKRCCQVETLEEHFGIDRYSEATLLSAPQITIHLQELVEVHQMLYDNVDLVAPSPDDPIRQILKELGPRPELIDFLTETAGQSPTDYSKTEILLSFKPDSNVEDGDMSSLDVERLFLKTKQLLVCVLPCTSGTLLARALRCPATEAEIEEYSRRVIDLDQKNERSQQLGSGMARFNSFLTDFSLPLDKLKERIYRNLKKLEVVGKVSKENGFAAILESLGRDILGYGKQRRSRLIELERLRIAKERLDVKTKSIKDQASYYNQYLQTCLSGLAPPVKKKRGVFQMTLKSHRSIKYTATKLIEKGVLIEIKGLEPLHVKSVIFEIKPLEKEPGKFKISAIYLGVNVEEIELDIQELLQQQYEGATIINLFGKAAININLLLHLLYAKFYPKK
ncbi:ras GTPase-activating-like protein IQGAP1 [Artemia franciscana]|nr:hypothetical protein QYM36_015342 [Artemia franciscana]